jgi:hypothetical protein
MTNFSSQMMNGIEPEDGFQARNSHRGWIGRSGATETSRIGRYRDIRFCFIPRLITFLKLNTIKHKQAKIIVTVRLDKRDWRISFHWICTGRLVNESATFSAAFEKCQRDRGTVVVVRANPGPAERGQQSSFDGIVLVIGYKQWPRCDVTATCEAAKENGNLEGEGVEIRNPAGGESVRNNTAMLSKKFGFRGPVRSLPSQGAF